VLLRDDSRTASHSKTKTHMVSGVEKRGITTTPSVAPRDDGRRDARGYVTCKPIRFAPALLCHPSYPPTLLRAQNVIFFWSTGLDFCFQMKIVLRK